MEEHSKVDELADDRHDRRLRSRSSSPSHQCPGADSIGQSQPPTPGRPRSSSPAADLVADDRDLVKRRRRLRKVEEASEEAFEAWSDWKGWQRGWRWQWQCSKGGGSSPRQWKGSRRKRRRWTRPWRTARQSLPSSTCDLARARQRSSRWQRGTTVRSSKCSDEASSTSPTRPVVHSVPTWWHSFDGGQKRKVLRMRMDND